MKIKNYITGLIVSVLLLPGCTSETIDGPDGNSDEVRFTATLDPNAFTTKATTAAPAGTYYMGYKTGKDTVSAVTVEGDAGKVSGTGIYWMNIALETDNKSFFTLSNVKRKEDKDSIPADRDILWASDKKSKGTKLSFNLNHLMAQVRVTIETPKDWNETIRTVSLENMQNDIAFDRTAGTANAAGNMTEITLPPVSGTDYYGLILPPQGRTDTMALKVTTREGKSYKRALPFSMDEKTDDGKWAGIPLKFRAGYILELTAEITNKLDYTILFTGATLQDWKYIGTSTIPARPAGIYTAGDLDRWISDYNEVKTDPEKSYKLKKYGNETDKAPRWTFYLRRDIDASSVKGVITDFTDILTQETSGEYHIKNKPQDDLLKLGTNGEVTNGVF